MVHIYNGILLSHKKRWNTAISNNMDVSWDYDAKQNKSDRKSWKPYDFTHMWDIRLKVTNKTNKNLETQTTVWWLGVKGQKGGGRKGKRGQTYGDGRFVFG